MHEIGKRAEAYTHFRRLHSRIGTPFLLTDVYIDQSLRARITDEQLRTRTSMRLIGDVKQKDISDARQTLTIGTADSEVSNHLKIALNDPVAIVHRSAVDAKGTLVIVAIGVYRGDVVRLDLKLK